MRDNHITDLLDNSPLRTLTEGELLTIRAHVETCIACRRSYEAAQISALLIEKRADEAAEKSLNVNPFFQTRVLAAWREQQTVNSLPAFRRLWNATGALVASMAATTAALAVLTFVAPSTEPAANQQTATLIPYTAEAVVLDQNPGDNQMTDDQVFSAIYADEDEGK